MKFCMNEEKNIDIKVGEKVFKRHAIKTRFVRQQESYMEIFREYVTPIYEKGDIVSCSEKIIALCQNRIIKRENIKIGFWAKVLSKCAKKTPAGIGIAEVAKMQYAINTAGLIKVIFASACSAVTKLFGKKGVFYKIVGREVAGLDGFYGEVWKEYGDMGIMLPENTNQVCDEIKKYLDISCMIVDANDLGVEILGSSSDIKYDNTFLKELIKDNPAGQDRQQTPLILIREC